MNDIATTRADLFAQGQIRLAELSVFNWGSFHGLHTASIDSDGTLVTGDNGAGKSTFIDGLMALLLPAGKATFNVAAAQGDRSDRSLLSYMRGSFGSAHDGSSTRVKSKREKGVVTGLRALYQCEDGSSITLAALFWTASSTNTLSDVKRVYLVAKRNMQLKELLDAFGEGNARQLKQWLRDDPAITDCDSNFTDYQELYRKHLYMDNKNAPALLSRALGLKKIDDLTKLIRELVLEPSGVKEDAKKVVEEFSDLVAIHEQ
ncbi:ATP-binding protein, partial [Oleiphilus sp. HI0132]|uniref:ATP-binding protein n=2 Tax=Oleiphilus sp. HI0132 TaxID=1822270 RepID=UPI000A89D2AF